MQEGVRGEQRHGDDGRRGADAAKGRQCTDEGSAPPALGMAERKEVVGLIPLPDSTCAGTEGSSDRARSGRGRGAKKCREAGERAGEGIEVPRAGATCGCQDRVPVGLGSKVEFLPANLSIMGPFGRYEHEIGFLMSTLLRALPTHFFNRTKTEHEIYLRQRPTGR